MDFKQIHLALRSGVSGNEEQVTVNQRHLIDKILARYSTEFTIYRELLQNSNDAGATIVTIRFQKKSSLVHTIEYKNNGRPFKEEDWARLRKIAEGNPDENKIGFFGVGFYSLFSICEEPFISSGNSCMAFFWRGDQLFTRRGELPGHDDFTTFLLELRETQNLPNIVAFGKFISTSLAFTTNLRRVKVFFDDHKVLDFEKKVAEARPITFSKSIYDLSSPNKIFNLISVHVNKIQLDVTVDRGKGGAVEESTLFMRTATGKFKVSLNRTMISEMERTTKKKPPSTTESHIMFSNWDEHESSASSRAKNSMFDDLVPTVSEQGRVFIGFPTHQTTGGALHLASHLIPTVERESIDFVDKTLNIWNQEILSTSGLLARLLYNDEFLSIRDMWNEMPKPFDPEVQKWLYQRAIHSMSSFVFHATTPSPFVGRILSTNFSKCTPSLSILIMSDKGVMESKHVRFFGDNEEASHLKKFLSQIPIVPDEICELQMIANLRSSSVILPVSLQDVLAEISKRTLTTAEMCACLRYWVVYRSKNPISAIDLSTFLKSCLVTFSDGRPPLPLANINHFVNPKTVTPGNIFPNDVLPLEISKHFTKLELESCFGSLNELSLGTWVSFISRNPDLKTSPLFAEKVLATIGRSFLHVPSHEKAIIMSDLSNLTCIPTKQGMKKPQDSYFRNVTLFDDIPVVLFPSQSAKELQASNTSAKEKSSFGSMIGGFLSSVVDVATSKAVVNESFLKALGVRDIVDLQMVFDRLDTLNWDHMQLVKYLASVANKMTARELDQLKCTPLFPREVDAHADTSRSTRYKASELYVPSEELRGLNVSILDWKGRWHRNSDEARFLSSLGLKNTLPLKELLDLAATTKVDSHRTKYLNYFVENYSAYELAYRSCPKPEFLPVLEASVLVTPAECFSDPASSVLGFKILRMDFRVHADKFGVLQHPSISQLIRTLETPPDVKKAASYFEYFAHRSADFSVNDWKVLSTLKFVPIAKNPRNIWDAPVNLYFVGEDKTFVEFFDYIDFGSIANTFLRNAGVKDQPNPAEIATMLIRNPQSFFTTMGFERYLGTLRQLAAHYPTLRCNTALRSEMKSSAFLVGLFNKTKVKHAETRAGHEAEELVSLEYKLALANDIHLIDDTILSHIFTPLGCPLEHILEDMYADLGSLWLSQCVREVHSPQGNSCASEKAMILQSLIQDRAGLLLYDGIVARSLKELNPDAEKMLKFMTVWEVPDIEIHREFGKRTNIQRTTACVVLDKNTKRHLLFISSDFDFFDVSSSLCKIVFRNPRLNDRLLVSTLLSTSLSNLRSKGFPVERILNLQQAKIKQVEASVLADKESQAQKSLEQDTTFQQLILLFPDIDPVYLRRKLQNEAGSIPEIVTRVSNSLLDSNYPKLYKPIETERHQSPQIPAETPVLPPVALNIASTQEQQHQTPLESSLMSKVTDQLNSSWWAGGLLKSMRKAATSTASSNNDPVTPDFTRNLESHLKRSLQTLSTSKDSSFTAKIPSDAPALPPSEASSRCRLISDSDLNFATEVNGLRVYVDKRASDKQARDVVGGVSLQRFSHLLSLLARVFAVQPGVFHVYWDVDGPTVAFNRARQIFFNLRFYTGLHFKQSMPGSFGASREDSPDAYVYWFLTACHEMAHNFQGNHDAEHEFYMSGFAETFMGALVRELRAKSIEF